MKLHETTADIAQETIHSSFPLLFPKQEAQ